MKTPEEIKKGLLVHAHTICDDLCPYYGFKEGGVLCSNELCGDALSYIEQLEQISIHWQSSMDQVEKALRDNGFGSLEELLQAYSRVKRERDAAVADARGRCFSCRHSGVDERDKPCRTCLFETEGCISDKPAWEWRGVPEPPKEDT